MMIRSLGLLRGFCGRVVKEHRNSINPVGQHVAFGHYFPKQWTQQIIWGQIDPSKTNIKDVQLVLNRLGQPSGKVLLKFTSQKSMQKCIQRYNQDFIITKQEAHRVIIKPFNLKTNELAKRNKQCKTKNRVTVKNLDFDISPQQLQRLGKDFGKVEFIEMHVRPNGLNDGLATVHFQRRSQAEDFAYFCNDLLYKERKLRAEVVEARRSEREFKVEYLVEPTITLDSHDYIFKKMVAAEKNKKTAAFKSQKQSK